MRSSSNTWSALQARRSVRPRRGFRRVVLVLLGLLLALIVLVALAYAYLTRTESGRQQVAAWLAAALTGEIPGSVTIGAIESLDTSEAVVRDLRFLHPSGDPVLHVKRAELTLDAGELLGGTIGLQRARVRGGHLIIAVQPDGRTGLEATFSEASSSSGSGGKKATLRMRSVHVEDLELTIRPAPDQVLRLRDVQGFVAIVQDDSAPGVRVRLDKISGELAEPQLLGASIELLRVDGMIRGAVEQVIDLDITAELDDGRFDAKFAYFDREKTKVEVELDPKEGVMTHLVTLGAELGTMFTDAIDVRLE